MGTCVYPKKGQVSKKGHVAKKQGKEYYQDSMYDRAPTLGGGPDSFDRRYQKQYRKTSLPKLEKEDVGFGY